MYQVIYLLPLLIGSSFACKGCAITKSEVAVCDDCEGVEISCAPMELTESCEVVWNCSRKMDVIMESGRGEASGSLNGLPFNEERDNVCDLIDEMKEKGIGGELDLRTVPDCGENWNSDGYVSETYKLSEEEQDKIRTYAGDLNSKLVVSDVNGIKGKNICIESSISVTCT